MGLCPLVTKPKYPSSMRTADQIRALQKEVGGKHGGCKVCPHLSECREAYPDAVPCELEDEDAGVEVNKATHKPQYETVTCQHPDCRETFYRSLHGGHGVKWGYCKSCAATRRHEKEAVDMVGA